MKLFTLVKHFLTSEAIPNPDNDNSKPNTNPAIISSNKYKINNNFISSNCRH